MLPKFSDDAPSVVGAEAPIPVNFNVCGLLGALVVTVIDVAATGPRAVGEKVTDILQLLPAASVVPHVDKFEIA
jgi:hypothetical protein